jgi:peptide deformylase
MKIMPSRRILQLGDPALRTVSRFVPEPQRIRPILTDLKDTLADFRRTHGFGRGISAIQIGDPVRAIFLRFDGIEYQLINPAYTAKSEDTFELWDDCFSFPNLMVRLRRHNFVSVRYQGLEGGHYELGARGALAELIQHEMDHLEGILAVDRAEGRDALATREEWQRRFQSVFTEDVEKLGDSPDLRGTEA